MPTNTQEMFDLITKILQFIEGEVDKATNEKFLYFDTGSKLTTDINFRPIEYIIKTKKPFGIGYGTHSLLRRKYRFPKEDLDYGDIIDMIKGGRTNVWILESEVR